MNRVTGLKVKDGSVIESKGDDHERGKAKTENPLSCMRQLRGLGGKS
jgi:hypothetical protein